MNTLWTATGVFVLVGTMMAGACDDRDVAGTKNPFAGSATTGPSTTSSGTAGGGGGSQSYSPCACLATLLDGDAPKNQLCKSCTEDSVYTDAECEDLADECDQDPECQAVVDCVKACDWSDDAASPDCFASCAMPRDRSMATMRYHASIDCSCNFCPSECEVASEPTCSNE